MKLLPVDGVSRPSYTFIGGMCYDTSPRPSTASPVAAKAYSGENYAFFRLYNTENEAGTYRSTFYANLPVAVFQCEDEAVGLAFDPLCEGKPLSVSIRTEQDAVYFDYRSDIEHLLRSKSGGFLGHWESETAYASHVTPPIVKRTSASTWMELVREAVSPLVSEGCAPERIRDAVRLAVAFYDRAFDAGHNVHTDTVSKDVPSDFGDPVYSYPSFESCRLMSLARADKLRADRWRKVADALLADEVSVSLPELGDVRVWHNAIKLEPATGNFTYMTAYGTGYSGWPGGMAYTLRNLANYCLLTGRSDAGDKLVSGLNWFLVIQAEDGGFPFNMATFCDLSSDRGRCKTGPKSKAVGGAGEAIRALCAGYRLIGDDRYIESAKKAASAVNPKAPYYAFRGYGDLRDAGDCESDATSGYSLGQANLDLFELTSERLYLDTAVALGYYLLTWHFWWSPGPKEIVGLIDPMMESFSPHASPWNTAMAAEFYCRIYKHTGDDFWLKVAHFVFSQCILFQNPESGGISETYPIRLDGTYADMGGESGMVTWALIDGGMAVLDALGVPYEQPVEACSTSSGIRVGISAELAVYDLPKPKVSPRKLVHACTNKFGKRFWKKLPFSVAMKIKQRMEVPKLSHRPPSAYDGPTRPLLLTPGSSLEGFTFTLEPDDVYTLRLASSSYTANVKKVCCPVLEFTSDVTEVKVTEKVGKTVVACRVLTGDGSLYEIRFLSGTDGLGAADVKAEGGRLLFDITLKALWQRAGCCTQRLSVRRCDTEVGK